MRAEICGGKSDFPSEVRAFFYRAEYRVLTTQHFRGLAEITFLDRASNGRAAYDCSVRGDRFDPDDIEMVFNSESLQ